MDTVKILGLLINAKCCNSEALNKLNAQVQNIFWIIARFANRRRGLKEYNLLRDFKTSFISHVTYIAQLLNRGKAEKNEIDTLIRTGLKRLLNLTESASTERLSEHGLYKTVDELIERT